MSEVKKVKMVFVGGRSAPSSYNLGETYELSETHLQFPWFIPAPEDTEVGDIVDYRPATETTEAKTSKAEPPLIIPPGLKGNFKMQFDGRARSAPSTMGYKGVNHKLETGMIFELPVSYARYPWWKLLDPLPEILIPDIEADTVYEEKVFIPPEVVEVVPLVDGEPAADDQPDAEPSEVEVPDEAVEVDPELSPDEEGIKAPGDEGEPEEVPLSEPQMKAMLKEDLQREMRNRGITYERFDTKDELIQKVLKYYAPA